MLGVIWSVLLSADVVLLFATVDDEVAAVAMAFFFGVTQFVVGLSSEVDIVTIFFSVLLLSPSSFCCRDPLSLKIFKKILLC